MFDFGVEWTNDQGRYLIQDKIPNYMFVGKAQFVGKSMSYDDPICFNASPYIDEDGKKHTRLVFAHHDDPGCAYDYRLITVSDSGVGRYRIYAPSVPLVFSMNASVLSVRLTGNQSGDGFLEYEIAMIAGGSAEENGGFLDTLEAYCFAKPQPYDPTGYGMVILSETGQTLFDDRQGCLKIKNGFTIHDPGFVVDDRVSDILVSSQNYSMMENTLVEVRDIEKPIFLGSDWIRYSTKMEPRGPRLDGWYYNAHGAGCQWYSGHGYSLPWITQTGISSGFSASGRADNDDPIRFAFDQSYVSGAGETMSYRVENNYTPIGSDPKIIALNVSSNVFIPILDGADYD